MAAANYSGVTSESICNSALFVESVGWADGVQAHINAAAAISAM